MTEGERGEGRERMIMKERDRILILYHTSAPKQCFPQHIHLNQGGPPCLTLGYM